MLDKLYKDPTFNELSNLVISGDCVVFIGSGLSRPIYPTWTDLINTLCTKCGVPLLGVESDPERLKETAQKCFDANKTAYLSTLRDQFNREKASTRPAYLNLLRLPFKGFVTLNFDMMLYDSRKRLGLTGDHFIYSYLPINKLDSKNIFQIHGALEHNGLSAVDKFILTADQFKKAYDFNKSLLPDFIRHLIMSENVLFLGTALEERFMLEHIKRCTKIREKAVGDGHKIPHKLRYAILTNKYFTQEENENKRRVADREGENREDRIFQSLDITTLRYSPKDEHEHYEIELISDKWIEMKEKGTERNAPFLVNKENVGIP